MGTFIQKRAEEMGLKLVDAKKDLVIELTQPDINKAMVRNSKCCAFARACKRQYRVKAAYFFRTTAWIEYEDRIERYIIPASMQKEIVTFDRAKIMEPGVYRLSYPTKSNTLGANRKRSAKKNKGPVKHRFPHRTAGVRLLFEPTAA